MNAKLGVALACLLNLGAGAAIGVAVDRTCGHHGPWGPRGPGGPGGPGGAADGMARRLGLSPEQKDKVRAIMDGSRPEIDKILSDHREKMATFRDRFDAQLRPILTDEQFAQLLEMRKELESRERAGPR